MKKIFDIFKIHKDINQLDLELLTAAAVQKDRVFVLTHQDKSLSWPQTLKLNRYINLYRKGYSVAAIIEKKEFFGLNFFVNKNVLIPRPETELLVQNVLEEINKNNYKKIVFDVGTGSGCIAISLAKNSRNTEIFGLDISSKAIAVAKKNNKLHGSKISIKKSNLLSAVKNINTDKYSEVIIAANLPYLRKEQVENEPTIKREPKLALIAKDSGLDLYKKLLLQIKHKELKTIVKIFIEIDPDQTGIISDFIMKNFPSAKLEIKKDLSNLDRLVKITL